MKNKEIIKLKDVDTIRKPDAKIIFLSGFMGSGKSYVGKIVAEKSEFQFIDLDREIEKTANLTVTEIFAKEGEEYFRKLETATLSMLIAGAMMIKTPAIIVALGGGAILENKNVAIIKYFGVPVLIDTDFETCYERIKDQPGRPLAKSRVVLENLYKSRRKSYVDNAKHILDGNAPADDVADKIVEIVNGYL